MPAASSITTSTWADHALMSATKEVACLAASTRLSMTRPAHLADQAAETPDASKPLL
jgi:hypothetical protein